MKPLIICKKIYFKLISSMLICLFFFQNIAWAYPDNMDLAVQSIFKPLKSDHIRDIGMITYLLECISRLPEMRMSSISGDINTDIGQERLPVTLMFSAKREKEEGAYVVPCRVRKTRYYAYITVDGKDAVTDITVFRKKEFEDLEDKGLLSHHKRTRSEEENIAHERTVDAPLLLAHAREENITQLGFRIKEKALEFFRTFGAKPDFLEEVVRFTTDRGSVSLVPRENDLVLYIDGARHVFKDAVTIEKAHASDRFINIPRNTEERIILDLVHELSAKCGRNHEFNKRLEEACGVWLKTGQPEGVISEYPGIKDDIARLRFVERLRRIKERDLGSVIRGPEWDLIRFFHGFRVYALNNEMINGEDRYSAPIRRIQAMIARILMTISVRLDFRTEVRNLFALGINDCFHGLFELIERFADRRGIGGILRHLNLSGQLNNVFERVYELEHAYVLEEEEGYHITALGMHDQEGRERDAVGFTQSGRDMVGEFQSGNAMSGKKEEEFAEWLEGEILEHLPEGTGGGHAISARIWGNRRLSVEDFGKRRLRVNGLFEIEGRPWEGPLFIFTFNRNGMSDESIDIIRQRVYERLRERFIVFSEDEILIRAIDIERLDFMDEGRIRLEEGRLREGFSYIQDAVRRVNQNCDRMIRPNIMVLQTGLMKNGLEIPEQILRALMFHYGYDTADISNILGLLLSINRNELLSVTAGLSGLNALSQGERRMRMGAAIDRIFYMITSMVTENPDLPGEGEGHPSATLKKVPPFSWIRWLLGDKKYTLLGAPLAEWVFILPVLAGGDFGLTALSASMFVFTVLHLFNIDRDDLNKAPPGRKALIVFNTIIPPFVLSAVTVVTAYFGFSLAALIFVNVLVHFLINSAFIDSVIDYTEPYEEGGSPGDKDPGAETDPLKKADNRSLDLAKVEGIKDMPAWELVNALGLVDPENNPDVEIMEKSEFEGLTVARIRISTGYDNRRVPGGLEILQNELLINKRYDLEEFDLLYNEEGALIAVLPVLPDTVAGVFGTDPEDLENDMGFRYFDLSYYYFNVPQIGSPDAKSKWSGFSVKNEKDRERIGHYKEMVYTAACSDQVRRVSFTSAPYIYAKIEKKNRGLFPRKWEKPVEFFPSDLDRIPDESDPDHYEIIIPVFPTVYSPGDTAHWENDTGYYEAVIDESNAEDKGDMLVIGPGSGFESWLVWLYNRRKIYSVGINPLEMANLRATAMMAGFEVETMVGDNIVSENGVPHFKDRKFKRVFWNMPLPRTDMTEQKPYYFKKPLAEYWDGDKDRMALKRFVTGLPLILENDGSVVCWTSNIMADTLERLIEPIKASLSREGIIVELKAYQYTPASEVVFFIRLRQLPAIHPEEIPPGSLNMERLNEKSGRVEEFMGSLHSRLGGIEPLFQGKRVMDLGAGLAPFAMWAKQSGASEVVGVDRHGDAVDMAQMNADEMGIDIEMREGDARSLDFPDASFDVVTSGYLFVFLRDEERKKALKEVSRVLSGEGNAVFFVHNDKVLERSYGSGPVPLYDNDSPEHDTPWAPDVWREELKSAGFETVEITPLWDSGTDAHGMTVETSHESVIIAGKREGTAYRMPGMTMPGKSPADHRDVVEKTPVLREGYSVKDYMGNDPNRASESTVRRDIKKNIDKGYLKREKKGRKYRHVLTDEGKRRVEVLDEHKSAVLGKAREAAGILQSSLMNIAINHPGEKILLALDDDLGRIAAVWSILNEIADIEDNSVFKRILKDVIIVRGKGKALSEEVTQYVEGRREAKVDRSNVILIADINSRKRFEKVASFANTTYVDNSRLNLYEHYYPLVEIILLSLARKLNEKGVNGYGEDRLAALLTSINADLDEDQNITDSVITLILKPAERFDYDELLHIYRNIKAFISAA